MQACCDTTFEYAHVRKQFGQPIGTFQVTDIRLSLALLTCTGLLAHASENGRHVHHTECVSIVSIHHGKSR